MGYTYVGVFLEYFERHVWSHDRILRRYYQLHGRSECIIEAEMGKKTKMAFYQERGVYTHH